ncbi:MAG: cytidine deaminase [Ginsengibacter sp.]
MKKLEYILSVAEYNSILDLNIEDSWLMNEARVVTQFAYAPYSNFYVGAVAKLITGEIVRGTNQENASYPAGICAERVLLSSLASQYHDVAIATMAISYNNTRGKSNVPISPCGICRQSIVEYQHRFQKPIRVLLSGLEGSVMIIEDAAGLLPMAFEAESLKGELEVQ